jgi:hypothetical protein
MLAQLTPTAAAAWVVASVLCLAGLIWEWIQGKNNP